jgi:hypothetical protein
VNEVLQVTLEVNGGGLIQGLFQPLYGESEENFRNISVKLNTLVPRFEPRTFKIRSSIDYTPPYDGLITRPRSPTVCVKKIMKLKKRERRERERERPEPNK